MDEVLRAALGHVQRILLRQRIALEGLVGSLVLGQGLAVGHQVLVVQIDLARCGFIGLVRIATGDFGLVAQRSDAVARDHLLQGDALDGLVGGIVQLIARQLLLGLGNNIAVA